MTKEINSWEDAIEIGEKLWGAIAKSSSNLFKYHHDNGSKSQDKFDFKPVVIKRLEKKENIVFPPMDGDCPFCEYATKLTRYTLEKPCSVCILHNEASSGCCSEWYKVAFAKDAKQFKSACQALYNKIVSLKENMPKESVL